MRTGNLYINRAVLIFTLYMSLWIGVNKSLAQSEQTSPTITSLLSSPSQLNLVTEPLMLNKETKKTNNHSGIVSGIIMISSGTIIALTSHYIGKDYYDQYSKSAFTENTERLRKRVRVYNAMQIGGGVLAGTGFIVMMVSF